MRSCRGFTLIELMVIMAIMAILVTVAAPSMSDSIARRRVEGAANELQADMQYAKTQSASANTNVQIITTTSGYTIGTATTPSLYKTIALESNTTLTSGVTINFEPYRSLPNAAATVTVSNSSTVAQLSVKVDANGIIKMCSPNGKIVGYLAC